MHESFWRKNESSIVYCNPAKSQTKQSGRCCCFVACLMNPEDVGRLHDRDVDDAQQAVWRCTWVSSATCCGAHHLCSNTFLGVFLSRRDDRWIIDLNMKKSLERKNGMLPPQWVFTETRQTLTGLKIDSAATLGRAQGLKQHLWSGKTDSINGHVEALIVWQPAGHELWRVSLESSMRIGWMAWLLWSPAPCEIWRIRSKLN